MDYAIDKLFPLGLKTFPLQLFSVPFSRKKMGSDFASIPIIDISPLVSASHDLNLAEDSGVQKVAKELDNACKEAGFFYVKGHGIPDSLLKEVKNVVQNFFDLPYEEKVKIKLSPATGYRGYQRIGENITLGKPDIQEAIDYYRPMEPGEYGTLGETMEGQNIWPEYPPNFRSLMEEYIILLKELAKKIMRGIALALGGPSDTFDGEIAGDSFWAMRLIGYPGSYDAKSQRIKYSIGCGAHTDYGLLTLINQDDNVNALQVRNKSGEWIWVVPIPGTFVCNIGDMLKVCSNGLYDATLHKVINNSYRYRVSVVFFYEPNYDTIVEPLEFCKLKTGGVGSIQGVIYGKHLVHKVKANFGL